MRSILLKIARLFKKSIYLPLVVSLALVLIVAFGNYANVQTPLTRNNGALVGENQNSQTAKSNSFAPVNLTNRQVSQYTITRM